MWQKARTCLLDHWKSILSSWGLYRVQRASLRIPRKSLSHKNRFREDKHLQEEFEDSRRCLLRSIHHPVLSQRKSLQRRSLWDRHAQIHQDHKQILRNKVNDSLLILMFCIIVEINFIFKKGRPILKGEPSIPVTNKSIRLKKWRDLGWADFNGVPILICQKLSDIIYLIYGREDKENIGEEELWWNQLWGFLLIYVEEGETDPSHWWGEVDYTGCCQGNRDQALHGQAYPVLVQKGGENLWEEEKEAWVHTRVPPPARNPICLCACSGIHIQFKFSDLNAH